MEFLNHLEQAVVQFPNLRILEEGGGNCYLRGVLDIPDDDGDVAGSFLIEIKRSKGFPFRFPYLFEVGGDIPNEADRHKYPDSSCCITVWTDEILKCKHGINVVEFIQNFAIPYFANQIYFKKEGKYKNGEYAHGVKGIEQFYSTLMKTSNKDRWVTYFKYAFRGQKIESGRNDICLCGGPLKFKNCHLRVLDTLRQIGEEQVLKDFNLLRQ